MLQPGVPTGLYRGTRFGYYPSHLFMRQRALVRAALRQQRLLPPPRKQRMGVRRMTMKKSNIANLQHSRICINQVSRQSHLITPMLQRRNGDTSVIINSITQPAKTSHRMRALPRFMQGRCELNAVSRNQPRPFQRVRRAAQQCSRKRDMAISAGGQRVVPDNK